MASLIADVKLAYGPVYHGYIKITSKNVDFEIRVKIAINDTESDCALT